MKPASNTQGSRSIIAENMKAVNIHLDNKRAWYGKPKMCWKCQKDKSPFGGYLKAQAGLFKFICKDCMDAKKLKETKID
jgi:hypothetical protein